MRAQGLGLVGWLVGLTLGLGGCGDDKPPIVKKAEALADRICACKTDECVGKAMDDIDVELKGALEQGAPPGLSAKDKLALDAAGERAERCAQASSGR